MFRRVFASLAFCAAAALVSAPAFAQTVALQPPPADFAAGPVKTGHLQAELVSETQGVAPGGLAYVAIRQDITPGWHTYWRNPGDSGEATSAKWTLPSGWSVGDMVWPAPQRLPLGPLMNYGYTGQVLLPVALNVPGDAKPGSTITLKADVTFLVCADICVPEQAKLKLDQPVVSGTPPLDPKWGAAIEKTITGAPKASGLEAAAVWAGQGADRVIKLAVTGDQVKGVDLSHAYFFPYAAKAVDYAAKQAIERGPGGLTLTLKPFPGVPTGGDLPPLTGVLSLGGQAYEVSAKPEPIPAEAGGLGAVTPAPLKAEGVAQSTAGTATTPAIPSEGAGLGLLPAVLFAFLGGLILNLMPCVFPVLSMKAASLAAHAHEPGEARSQGLAFLGGVLVAFLSLAGLVLAAKAGGAAVGWGFQLQSPAVVGSLALIMLLVALNMSGVFEATLPGTGAGAGLAAKGGLVGSFFTGLLAVVVAAPCTAPFMAPALGFALTQSPPAALLVFVGLGLGFAAPFTAISFAPALRRLFPRPGAWMDTFKHILAFPMYGTAAWLLWVFTLQAGSGALALLLAAAVLAGFCAWLLGSAQTSGKPLVPGIAAVVAAGLAIACLAAGARETAPAAAQTASGDAAPAAPGKEADSEPFSVQKLADLRAAGKPVFVNFTAAWCVTCQVNERLALGSPAVAKALADTGAVYLKADWTNHDGEIAKLLAEHGRAGVPLYLVYGASGGDPAVLPQLLTPGGVASAIRAAGKAKT